MIKHVLTPLLLSALVFLMVSCGVKKSSSAQDLRTTCCQECVEAFSKSPVGVGADAARCGSFNSAAEISSPCQKYFKEKQVMVSECQ